MNDEVIKMTSGQKWRRATSAVMMLDVVKSQIFLVPTEEEWERCAEMMRLDGFTVTGEEARRIVLDYFRNLCGIEPYQLCPKCGQSMIIPRRGKYGFFIGCDSYPACDFMATKQNKYVAGPNAKKP